MSADTYECTRELRRSLCGSFACVFVSNARRGWRVPFKCLWLAFLFSVGFACSARLTTPLCLTYVPSVPLQSSAPFSVVLLFHCATVCSRLTLVFHNTLDCSCFRDMCMLLLKLVSCQVAFRPLCTFYVLLPRPRFCLSFAMRHHPHLC